jgi:hypothetical protein
MTYLGWYAQRRNRAGGRPLGALNTTAASGRRRWYDGNLFPHNSIGEYAIVTGNPPCSVRSYSHVASAVTPGH